jgi:hypothetical protein
MAVTMEQLCIGSSIASTMTPRNNVIHLHNIFTGEMQITLCTLSLLSLQKVGFLSADTWKVSSSFNPIHPIAIKWTFSPLHLDMPYYGRVIVLV